MSMMMSMSIVFMFIVMLSRPSIRVVRRSTRKSHVIEAALRETRFAAHNLHDFISLQSGFKRLT